MVNAGAIVCTSLIKVSCICISYAELLSRFIWETVKLKYKRIN